MDESRRALDKALRSLAARAHSEQEIVRKLERAGFEERAIAEAMAKLADYSLVDDSSFAEQWAKSRARRGLGPYRIAHELREKGIDSETVQSIIDEMDEDDALDAATELAYKQLCKGGANARKRAYDAVIRRGHSYDVARQALSQAQARVDEEEEDT